MPPRTINGRIQRIQRLNHRHQGILNWLVLNPHRALGECASELGYTQAWLSSVVHSDAFQAVYRARCAELGSIATHTISARLGGLAEAALSSAEETIRAGLASEKFVGDTMKTTLQALGYTPERAEGGLEVHQHLHVDADVLRRARERVLSRSSSQGEAPQLVTAEVVG